MQLVGFKFPDQGLNPGLDSESAGPSISREFPFCFCFVLNLLILVNEIIEKTREFQKNICFIDYIKAFDCVDDNKLENS